MASMQCEPIMGGLGVMSTEGSRGRAPGRGSGAKPSEADLFELLSAQKRPNLLLINSFMSYFQTLQKQ